VRIDTIPKPVGLAEGAATASLNGDRAEIERGPDVSGLVRVPFEVGGLSIGGPAAGLLLENHRIEHLLDDLLGLWIEAGDGLELELEGIVLALLLGHDQNAFIKDVFIYSSGITLLFFTTGYR
jgi:hypothetical protein